MTFDHILVHDTQHVAAHQSVAIGSSDTRKIVDNFLLPMAETPMQGKHDAIPRNTLKHDAEKVFKKIKSLF